MNEVQSTYDLIILAQSLAPYAIGIMVTICFVTMAVNIAWRDRRPPSI